VLAAGRGGSHTVAAIRVGKVLPRVLVYVGEPLGLAVAGTAGKRLADSESFCHGVVNSLLSPTVMIATGSDIAFCVACWG